MNRIDYIYPTALEQIKAAINGGDIPINDGNRDGGVQDVRYFSKAALEQIKGIGRRFNSEYLTTNGSRYGIALLIPSVNLQTQEGGLKFVGFKHFSEFTKNGSAHYVKYDVPESDVLNACLGPALAPNMTQLSGAWYFLIDDFDGEFTTKCPIGSTIDDPSALVELEPYFISLSDMTTGSEGQAIGVDYIKGTQYVDGTTEIIFSNIDFEGARIVGGAICYADGVNRVITANSLAAAMSTTSLYADITKTQNWFTFFQDGEDIWQICVEAPIPTIPS